MLLILKAQHTAFPWPERPFDPVWSFFPVSSTIFMFPLYLGRHLAGRPQFNSQSNTLQVLLKKTKNLRVLSGQGIESYLACSFIGMRGFFWECVWKMVVIPAAILDADRIWHFSMTNRLCLFCQWLPRGETNLQPSFIELSSPFRSVDNKLTFSIDWPPRNFFFLRL